MYMKNLFKKNLSENFKKMNLLEDLKISLLTFNFNFVLIYLIHKILVLLNNLLNYLKDNIFKCFLRKYNRSWFFFKKLFSQHIMMEYPSPDEAKTID